MKKVLFAMMMFMPMVASAYDFKVGDYAYNIVSAANLTVEIAKTNGELSYSGSLTFPEQVEYSGKTFKVVGIGESAFLGYSNIASVETPNSFEYVGIHAFASCENLTSAKLCNVKQINKYAFSGCQSLKMVEISEDLVVLGEEAFFDTGIESISLPNTIKGLNENTFGMCRNLKHIKLPDGIEVLPSRFLQGCSSLTSIDLPESLKSINRYAFIGCTGLTEISFPKSVFRIDGSVFSGCDNLTKVIFNSSNIDFRYEEYSSGEIYYAFDNCNNIQTVVLTDPNPSTSNRAFSQMTYLFATLFVPKGTVDAYKATEGWNYFVNIEEYDGDYVVPEKTKCAVPTITYSEGKLTFTCETEGAECVANISDADIKTHYGNEISLTATYTVSVYATATGYENSDVVTAMLCWIDADPKTEGIENGLAQVRANAVLIQSHGGKLSIAGVVDGADIAVYSTSGQMVGSAKAHGTTLTISTSLRSGNVAIVRIGDKTVKVVMQ
jgi:hypothetical protein